MKAQASQSKASPAKKAAVAMPVKKAHSAPPAKSAKSVKPPPATKPVAKPAAKVATAVTAKSKAAGAVVKVKPPVAKPVPAKSAKASKPAVHAAPVKAKPVIAPAKQVPVKPNKSSEPVKQVSPKVIKATAPPPPPVKPPVVAPVVTSSGVPVRSGRPSSRLAQLTVPSIAQSVASTAAKASFTQMISVQPIISPLASATKRNPKLASNWKSKPVAELIDEEIIAMPDDVYMNDVQLAFFRLKLVQLKDEILSSAGQTTEHLREDTVVVPDPADRATIEEEHALELRTRDRERKLLKKIEQSIDRIDAGDYGYCDETGEPIGVGRLLARPTATLSLEAQQRRELKQKMFGD